MRARYKLMIVLAENIHDYLKRKAEARGIGLQELIRAVIVPPWVEAEMESDRAKRERKEYERWRLWKVRQRPRRRSEDRRGRIRGR